jgi:hypothetical protein
LSYNPTQDQIGGFIVKNHIQLFSVVIIVILLTACAAQPAVTVVAPTIGPVSSAGSVPNSLVTIEAAAEDIIDFAPSGGWDKINKDVTDIENAWKSYEPQAGKDGASNEIQDAMNTALAGLKTATASKDADATMQGSNDVSAAVVELFALYSPNVPADIGRLDVLERQVILDVAAKNYSAAKTSLAKIMSVWSEVKPSVLEHDGKDVAAQFQESLDTQVVRLDSKNYTDLTDEARNALEIVDALEGLY